MPIVEFAHDTLHGFMDIGSRFKSSGSETETLMFDAIGRDNSICFNITRDDAIGIIEALQAALGSSRSIAFSPETKEKEGNDNNNNKAALTPTLFAKIFADTDEAEDDSVYTTGVPQALWEICLGEEDEPLFEYDDCH